MKTKSTGALSLNFRIDILGSEPESKRLNIIANSVGPKVECKEKELKFDVKVLEKKIGHLKLHNNSPISAAFHCFTKNANSIFKPMIKKGIIPKESFIEIEVFC